MTLQSQHIEIPLIAGVDTKTAEEVLDPPALRVLANADLSKPGKIRLRNAYEPLNDGTVEINATAGYQVTDNGLDALVCSDRELVAFRRGQALAFLDLEEAEGNVWRVAGPAPTMQTRARVVLDDIPGDGYDYVTGTADRNVLWVAAGYADGTRVSWLALDRETNAIVFRDDFDGEYARVVPIYSAAQNAVIGSHLLFTRQDGAGYELVGKRESDSEVVLATDVNPAAPYIDAMIFMGSTWVTYQNTDRNIRVLRLDALLSEEAAYTKNRGTLAEQLSGGGKSPEDHDLNCITIYGHPFIGQPIVVAWASQNDVRWVRADDSSAVTQILRTSSNLSNSTVQQIAVSRGRGFSEMTVFFQREWDEPQTDIEYYAVDISTLEISDRRLLHNYALAHKPYEWTDRNVYIGVTSAHQQDLERVYITAMLPLYAVSDMQAGEAQHLHPAGKYLFPQASGKHMQGHLSDVAAMGPDLRHLVWFDRSRSRVRSEDGEVVTGNAIARMDIDLAVTRNHLTAVAGGMLFMAGSVPQVFVGSSWADVGFLHPPPKPRLVQESGGGLTENATYAYVVVWEWRDSAGRVWRSPPSVPEQIELEAGEGTVLVRVEGVFGSHTRFTSPRGSAPVLAVYRTKANLTTYYRVSDPDAPLAPAHDTLALAYMDTASDDDIGGNELLYTTGGVLEHYAPPPSAFMWEHQDRLWCINSEDGTIWPSGIIEPNEGVWWHPGYAIAAARESGVPVAGCSFDGKSIIFWERAIGFVYGDGPNRLGAGEFSPITPIASDVGCINPRTVVVLPQGVMFMSHRGIYMLTKDMVPQYVGAPVEDWNGELEGCVGAALVEDRHEVRFTTAQENQVIYDYLVGQWHITLRSLDVVLLMTEYDEPIATEGGDLVQVT